MSTGITPEEVKRQSLAFAQYVIDYNKLLQEKGKPETVIKSREQLYEEMNDHKPVSL